VDFGDIQLRPAHTLRGKVLLSDGGAIPPDMHVSLFADQASSQFAALSADGSFEFRGLPPGVYEIAPAVKGYRQTNGVVEVLVQRDVTGLTIRMEPATDRP
jgi:hypothetical protein